LDKARTDFERKLYDQCLNELAQVFDPENKIKILEGFIKQHPSTPYLSEINTKIEELKAEVIRIRQEKYEACLKQANDLQGQGLFVQAFQKLIEAKNYTTDFSQVNNLITKLELAFLESKGIVPQGDERDPVSKLHQFIISKPDAAEMVLIPASEFMMGRNEGEPDEQPAHPVKLDDYYMDLYEVTNAQFSSFVQATGYKTEAEKSGYGWVWQDIEPVKVPGASWKNPQGDGRGGRGQAPPLQDGRGDPRGRPDLMDHPVVQVSWSDAVEYARWAGKRLATEAEWEKAARGTQGFIYPWGNNWQEEYCYYAEVSSQGTILAKGYPTDKSPYACYQMAGNVTEWCADWYDKDFYRRPEAKDNPQGPKSGSIHIFRGGSWVVSKKLLLTSLRLQANIGWSNYIGFRCVKDAAKDLIPYLNK
jgi:formylglycine-generating enzyme required for sulfatase activity